MDDEGYHPVLVCGCLMLLTSKKKICLKKFWRKNLNLTVTQPEIDPMEFATKATPQASGPASAWTFVIIHLVHSSCHWGLIG